MKRPMLDTEGQINHLKSKGVGFSIISDSEATEYLSNNNNFFKLTSYRKNYSKNAEGKYVNLEFAYLVDMAIIDMRLRYCFMQMCLDIEHFARVRIIKTIEEKRAMFNGEDGYLVVKDFKDKYPEIVKSIYDGAKKSPYCSELIAKHESDMPVWAFVEILQFGELTRFYRFVAERFSDRRMQDELFMLQEIRKLRNACAHSNCIINDLKSKTNETSKPNNEIWDQLAKIGVSRDVRRRKMSNPRIRQITTLLYFSHIFVRSSGVKKRQSKQLHKIVNERMLKHEEYYRRSEQYLSFCQLLKKLVDNWYPIEV